MKGINQVHYIGSITQQPELKYTPGGLAILELTVAGKEEVVTAGGQSKTAFFYNRCKAFGGYAEALAESFSEGDVVSVHGRLDHRTYEVDGEKRSTVETVITSVQTLEGSFITEDDRRGQPVLLGGLNSVTLGGNLTKDAELRYTPSGTAVTRLSVAVNERYGSEEGQEKVGYFDLQGWGELAEALGAGDRGRGVIGVGRLVGESWEKDGQKRYATKVELERGYYVSPGNTKHRAPAQSVPKPSRKGARTPPPPSLDGPSDARTIEEFPPEENLPF